MPPRVLASSPKPGATSTFREDRDMATKVRTFPGRAFFLALAFVAAVGGDALAQTGAASVTGLVTDQSGGAAPGVTVTATNQATNVGYTAVTNQAGNYTITSVPV